MTHDEKMKGLREIFDKCIAVADAKGRDYSGTKDAMSNFRDFGWRGIIVRLGDKYHRIKNLCQRSDGPAVKDESVDDTLFDAINYSALALIMKWEEEAQQTVGPFIDAEHVLGRSR